MLRSQTLSRCQTLYKANPHYPLYLFHLPPRSRPKPNSIRLLTVRLQILQIGEGRRKEGKRNENASVSVEERMLRYRMSGVRL